MKYQYSISLKRMGMRGFPSLAKASIKSKDIYFYTGYQFPVRADYNIKMEDIPDIGLLPKMFDNIIGFEKYDSRLYKLQIKTNSQKFSFYIIGHWDLNKIFKENNTRLKKDDIVLNAALKQIWPKETHKTPNALIKMHEQQKQK